MKILRVIAYVVVCIPAFLILLWLFAVPTELLREKIEDSVTKTGNSNMSLSIDGLRKGIFFALYADSINLKIDKQPALSITGFSCRFAPGYLSNGEVAFKVHGKTGDGDLDGIIKLPIEGNLKLNGVALTAIPYLTRFGIDIMGHASSNIEIKGDGIKITLDIPDLNIDDSDSVVPLLNTFRKLQGALSIKGNIITIDSVSLEGEKGFARLKGDIKNGKMDLTLELMPDREKLNAMESMLIGKYIISPGYYAVPIRGPLR